MRIRTFTLDDYDAVYAFWKSIEKGIDLGRSDSREEVAKLLERSPGLSLLAEDDKGHVIGTVLVGFDGRRGLIYHLAVRSDYRRRGLGRALMAAAEDRLCQQGCLKYYLLVHRDNTDAIRFYEKLGLEDMTTHIIIMGKVIA
jgi:ribosomal protein S18 acetylase RimI-like enzyme